MTTRWFNHAPVLAAETVAILREVPAGVVLDATIGGAGHAVALLDVAPQLSVIGIDQDAAARRAATEKLAAFGDRARIVAGRFDALDSILDDCGVSKLSGFLFDLGVSSPQLDLPERGFSFRLDGPLDMRMDQSAVLTAEAVVNTWSVDRLASAIRIGGDERFAGRISKAIVAARPITRTEELAAIVVQAIPAATRRTGGHPAKRTFQAIRIAVNSELEILEPSLRAALSRLSTAGRGVVLTYHSGEDRIVKGVFRELTTSPTPVHLPVPEVPAPYRLIRPVTRTPGTAELESNPAIPKCPTSGNRAGGGGRMTATVASRPRTEKKVATRKKRRPAKRPAAGEKTASKKAANQTANKKTASKKAKPRGSQPGRRSISSAGLFVVDFAALRSRTRRRRMVIVSLILLVGAFFGVALVQAQLVQTQSDLDRLQQEISVLENDIALLDRSVVVASSPEEVVRRAKALGMVRSVRPVYLVATRPLSP